MDNLTVLELKQILEDKIKTLIKLEAKIEKSYEIGDIDYADHLDMISGVVIEDIIEIKNLLMDNLTVLELKQILEDKIKTLIKLEAKIEKSYEIGDIDYADHLDMISGVVIEDIIEIEKLLGV